MANVYIDVCFDIYNNHDELMSGLRGYGDLLMLMYRWRGLFHLKLELQHYIERHLLLLVIKLANYLGNICVGLKSKSPNTLCFYLLHPGPMVV